MKGIRFSFTNFSPARLLKNKYLGIHGQTNPQHTLTISDVDIRMLKTGVSLSHQCIWRYNIFLHILKYAHLTLEVDG